MFTRIITGTDGSEAAERALRMACNVAQKYGAELHVLHVPQPQTVAFAMGAVAGYHAVTTMPSDAEITTAANKLLDAAEQIATEAGHPITARHFEIGAPAETMVTHADKIGADLIVTGRRGLGNLSAVVLGSTSQRIAHTAKCACLTVA